ncbi:hypothetical protein J7J83_02785 [bacterium]|nr:hypothetical protein [bacterium]
MNKKNERSFVRGEVERVLANYASLAEIPEITHDDILRICINVYNG